MTDEELDSLEKRAGDGEIAGADYQVDQVSQALNRLRAMVTAPEQQCQYCPIALAFQRVLGRGPQEPSALIHAQPVPQADPF